MLSILRFRYLASAYCYIDHDVHRICLFMAEGTKKTASLLEKLMRLDVVVGGGSGAGTGTSSNFHMRFAFPLDQSTALEQQSTQRNNILYGKDNSFP